MMQTNTCNPWIYAAYVVSDTEPCHKWNCPRQRTTMFDAGMTLPTFTQLTAIQVTISSAPLLNVPFNLAHIELRAQWHRLNLLRIFCVINYQLPTDVMHRINVKPFLLTEKQQFCSVYCYCSFSLSLSHFHTHSLSICSLFIASFTHTRAREHRTHAIAGVLLPNYVQTDVDAMLHLDRMYYESTASFLHGGHIQIQLRLNSR